MVNVSRWPTLPPIGWRDPAATLGTCSRQARLLADLVPDALATKPGKTDTIHQ